MKEIDNFYLSSEEPEKSCLMALKTLILAHDDSISEAWKYKMPFFCFKGRMFCYLWFHKKYNQPYIGFVEGKLLEHPDLLQEKRSRMKILLIDPIKDLPVELIQKLLTQAIHLYANGKIRIK